MVGILLAAWALSTPPAAPEGTSSPRELVAALRDGRVAGGVWLIAVPGLLFGTIGVLAPLRLDDLGVGAAVIGAAWLDAALLESGVSPIVGRVSDRRGRLFPCMIGLTLGAALMLLFPWPNAAWQLIVLVIVSRAGGRDALGAVDGAAVRRRGGARHRSGIRVRAQQPRLVDRADGRRRQRARGWPTPPPTPSRTCC